MKKLFMEPEVKITKFEDEDLMRTSGVEVGAGPGMGDGNEGSTDFEDWF